MEHNILPGNLRMALAAALVIYFILILVFLKKKAIELKYTLLWLLAGTVMALLIIFPNTLPWFVHLFGIADNMNGLFIFCIAFLMMIVMELTSIVSRQARKIRSLTQSQAILEHEIRELKNRQGKETRESGEQDEKSVGNHDNF